MLPPVSLLLLASFCTTSTAGRLHDNRTVAVATADRFKTMLTSKELSQKLLVRLLLKRGVRRGAAAGSTFCLSGRYSLGRCVPPRRCSVAIAGGFCVSGICCPLKNVRLSDSRPTPLPLVPNCGRLSTQYHPVRRTLSGNLASTVARALQTAAKLSARASDARTVSTVDSTKLLSHLGHRPNKITTDRVRLSTHQSGRRPLSRLRRKPNKSVINKRHSSTQQRATKLQFHIRHKAVKSATGKPFFGIRNSIKLVTAPRPPKPIIYPITRGNNVTVTVSLPVGKWPWMARLGQRKGRRIVWLCGGVLVGTRTVLTAAHCVFGRRGLVVRLGEVNSNSLGHHTQLAVGRALVHPSYRQYAEHHDLALLRLTSAVTFNRRVQPVCLPPPHAPVRVGQRALVAGWGRLKHGDPRKPTVLQEASVSVTDPIVCATNYRLALGGSVFSTHFPGGFGNNKMCANGVSLSGGVTDACKGDSGGPLVVTDAGGRRRLIGIVGTGILCGTKKYPGIYTKVSEYVKWIIKNGL